MQVKKSIREKVETEYKDLNQKYFNARNEYNRIKTDLNESVVKIRQIDDRLRILVIECVSLKTYISEVNKTIPVS